MANTFATVQKLADMSALFIAQRLGYAARVNRSVEGDFKDKGIGTTVDVVQRTKVAKASTYSATSGTVTAVNLVESKIPVVITDQFYQAAILTATQKTMEVKDLFKSVISILLFSVIEQIEDTLWAAMVGDFARNQVGTEGNEPSTLAHITAAVAGLKDGEIPMPRGGYQSFITTTAWANFVNASEFKSRDFGSNREGNLTLGTLAPISGVKEFFDSQVAGTFPIGTDIAGTVLVDGASQTGTTLHVDAFTAAAGTVVKGTRFTIEDDPNTGNIYTTTADVTIASNEVDLLITPSISSAVTDGKIITFKTAFKENLIMHPDAYAAVVIAPVPLESTKQSAVSTVDGFEVRVSTLQHGLDEKIVVDTLYGAKLLTQSGGFFMNG